MNLDERTALATVCHELRTPLTSIRGYIETLLDEKPDPATARRFLQTTRREVLRLGRLVESVLEFSMLDFAPPRLTATACNAVEQIHAAIEIVRPLAARRLVTIRTRLPRTARVRVNADTCVRAVANLLENAVKHGRAHGTIEIACRCGKRFVEIIVDDDGPGIAPAERESVFSMGVRGARAHAGSGVGLAVVKGIAERAGGSVKAESSSTFGGARFVLRLPAG